jgi:hypoxanthine phosphoribosyltransferase
LEADLKEILLTESEIQKKVIELGHQLADEYKHKNPLVVCILKGAAPFVSDLTRQMNIPVEIDYMDVSSYGASTQSSGQVKIIKDLNTSVEGRDILLVEDIIDTGLTLQYLVQLFHYRKAKSIQVVTLLDKPERRKVDIRPDVTGFVIPDAFVVGYGLDYAEKYRNLPYIAVLKPEIYS